MSVTAYNVSPDRTGYEFVQSKMEELARADAFHPALRAWATRRTRHVPRDRPAALLSALFRAVKSDVTYREDPQDAWAYIRAPHVTLTEGVGNCIDQATLLASALYYLGSTARTRFVTQGDSPDDRWHVYLEVHDGNGGWTAVDTTLPGTMGRLGLRAPAPQEWRRPLMEFQVPGKRFTAPRMCGMNVGRLGFDVGRFITGIGYAITGAETEEERRRKEQAASTQKLLLYGGLAVGALVLLPRLLK